MRVDLDSLGTFNRIGTAGAARAADALSTLTGLDTTVETTRINFAPVEDLSTPVDDDATAVSIQFEGGLRGHALLVFDAESAEHVLAELDGAGHDPDSAALEEVTNIVTSGFVDGWADHLDATIDISTPTALEEAPPGTRLPTLDGFSFVFQSELLVEGPGHGATFHLLPDSTQFLETIDEAGDGAGDRAVGVPELSAFIRLTAAGGETVAENLGAMTGIETDVAVSHLQFVPIEDVPRVVPAEQYTGTVFQFSGAMAGYLAVLFETDAADAIAAAMAPGETIGESMRQSALEEIGNVIASSFIDGWANALDTTIDHSVPDFVDDMGRAVLESVAARLARTQEFAFVFDVAITADAPTSCRVFAFPDQSDFRSVVSALDEDLDVSTIERV
ncbi:MAG: chemotaxis protein CheC [Halanaeroarchaeum sp.]